MLKEQRLFERLHRCLRSAFPEPEPELAEQLARLCEETNRRLEQCSALLARGLRSEALHQAQAEPPLLPLCHKLSSAGVVRWQELCLTHELPVPGLPAPELVELLHVAVQAAGTGELPALQRLYRRACLIGHLRERLAVLRRIRQLEPKNPHWSEDLRALEAYRFELMRKSFAQARQREDAAAAERLWRELVDSPWLQPPPPAMRQSFEQGSRELRQQRLAGEGTALAGQIARAYSSLSYEELGLSLARWAALEAQPDFSSGRTLAEQVEEARDWHAEQTARRKAESDFKRALVALEEQLHAAQSPATLARALAAARACSPELPVEVERHAELRLAELQRSRRRRLLLKVAAAVCLLLLLAGGAYAVVQELGLARQRSEGLRQLRTEVAAERWQAADGLLRSLLQTHPSLQRDPECARLEGQVQRALQESRLRQQMCAQHLDQLQAMEAVGFQPLRRAERLLEDAGSLVGTDAVLQRRVRSLSSAVQTARERAHQAVDSELELLLAEVEAGLQAVEAPGGRLQADVCGAALERLATRLGAAAALSEASPALRAPLPGLRQRLSAQQEALQGDLRRITERRAELQALYHSLPDLAAWGDAVRAAAQRLDLSAGTASQIAVLADDLPFYQALPQPEPVWRLFAGTPDPQLVDELLADLPADARAARGSLAMLAQILAQHSALRAALGEVYRLGDVDLYARLRRCSNRPPEGDPQLWYFLEPPELTLEAAGVSSFRGQMYDRNFSLISQSFQHDTPRIESALVPHAAFLQGALQRLRDCREPAAQLWQELQSVALDRDLEPVVALVFARRLLAPLAGLDEPLLAGFAELESEWERFSAPVLWLAGDAGSFEAGKSRRAALDALPELGPELAAWQLRERLVQASLSRQLRCVGQVRAVPQGSVFEVQGAPQELWLLRQDAVFVAAVREGDHWQPQKGVLFREGEPLFAPSDRVSTRDLLRELVGASGLSPEQFAGWQAWPPLWPENARGLAGGL